MRWSHLLSYLRPYRRWVILAPVFMTLEVAMDLMLPRLVQKIVDEAIPKGDQSLVLQYASWMLLATVIGIATGGGCGFTAVRAAQGFGNDLRRDLYRKVQSLSFGNLDQLESASLITRLTSDITQVQDILQMVLRGMVRAPLLLVGGLTMAILTSPRLSLLFIALIPIVLAFVGFVIQRTYPIYREVQHRLDNLNTRIQETLSGVRVIKAFARSPFEVDRFAKANESLRDGNLSAARFGILMAPFMTVVVNAGVVAALWMGGVKVTEGEMTVGQIVAFVNYLTYTLNALIFLSMMVTQFSRAVASAERIEEVFDAVPQIVPASGSVPLPTPAGRLAFERVSFRYGDAEDALHDVSFVAEAGQTVAILGATGSGKSTLVNLIPRFYDPSGGRITLDGVDLRDYPNEEIRHRLGIALQEAILFSGTIRENIRYGKPDATDSEVEWAARTAQAEEFITRLPEGYETVVGQRGVNLSGGQKQRLAIARALLVHPQVLVLDDSTSAVDVHTEARLQNAFATEAAGQTRVIVAQRVRSALYADKILILDEGRLIAEGTHAELLQTSEVYREIYESQEGNGEEAHA